MCLLAVHSIFLVDAGVVLEDELGSSIVIQVVAYPHGKIVHAHSSSEYTCWMRKAQVQHGIVPTSSDDETQASESV